MLVSEKPYELAGFFSAVDDEPSFVVPLFRSRTSNLFLVQEVGSDDAIHAFREVDPRHLCRIEDSGARVDVGDQALWGFRDAAMRPIIATREQLRDDLIPLLQHIEQPFLRLQVAQFCEQQSEIIDGWRQAFAHIEERSPRSASAWRDVVVIPTQVRLAVETAILSNGLDLPTGNLGRHVDVSVGNGRLRLLLEAKMHAALSRHEGARTTLERLATPVRQAFRIAATPLELIAKGSEPDPNDRFDADRDGLAVAGFGRMAMSLLAQVFPRITRSADGRQSHWLSGAPERQSSALLQGEQLTGGGDWATGAEVTSLGDDVTTAMVVFQLGADQAPLMERALAFAASNRRPSRTIVAVLPHLPQEFDSAGELARSVFPTLRREFDDVWALSDRSPYTRQSLPYGPARSSQAAATHFRALLRRAREDGLRPPIKAVPRTYPMVAVIGSAVGDQPIAKLVEHAMLRLRHHLFDFKATGEAAVVSWGQQDAFEGVVREIVHRDAPDAKVTLSSTPKRDGGVAQVTVALEGVHLLDGGDEEFERYCAGEFRRFGWDIDQFEPNGPMHVTKGSAENLPVTLRYVNAGSLEAAIKTRKRRHHEDDGVMLTNAIIRRRSFALHTLNGLVPVHCSRVEALHRIYRRRYAYAISYLRQETKAAERIIVPAALDWLNLHHWFDNKNVGKAKVATERELEFDFEPQTVSLSLPLEVTRGRGGQATVTHGRAQIRLDEAGWRLLRLVVADEVLHAG